jgi:hypothetical protein
MKLVYLENTYLTVADADRLFSGNEAWAKLASDYQSGVEDEIQEFKEDGGLFLAKLFESKNADYAAGSAAINLHGGATYSDGQVILSGDAHIDIENNGNLIYFKGAVRIEIEPQYSGSPASDQLFFHASDQPGGTKNMIEVIHKASDGKVYVSLSDALGGKEDNIICDFAPVSGTKYLIEFDYNSDDAKYYFYIDGVKQSATYADKLPKNGEFYHIQIGNTTSNFNVSRIELYGDIIHTASYIRPEYERALTDKELFLCNASMLIDNSFVLKGRKISDAQPMQFPRYFSKDHFLYSETKQKERLKQAVFEQIEHWLNHKTYGAASLSNATGAGPTQKKTGIGPETRAIMSWYSYNGADEYYVY